MSKKSTTQSLSYPLRLPDDAQVDALRLLDVSRCVTNQVITTLWPRLDEFSVRTNTYAYKHIEAMIAPPVSHGSRLFRCEAEQAGRILRAQAERKQQFALIYPLLTEGMIVPRSESPRPRKHRPTIKQALDALKQNDEDGGSSVELLSLVEQACNFYFKNGCFPASYEEMQNVPVMQAAQLPYAGDDGGSMGQAYRMAVDFRQKQIALALRTPDAQGNWSYDWGVRTLITATVVDLDGHQLTRPFFLDTGCFDGEQARTRRQIDVLKAKVAKLEAHRDRLQGGDARRERCLKKVQVLRKEISLCWCKYEARNHDLAHMAANVLLLLAVASGCSLIAGESLKSMKSQGRGRDAKGKWRNWRNNTQVRGEIWRILKYKCFLTGIHLEWQHPRGTSHTCPHCGKPADTYKSSEHLGKTIDWGAWLCCEHCGWSGSRDYAASLNIARLGAAWLKEAQQRGRMVGISHPKIQEKNVKPVCYMLAGSPLRFPARSPRACLLYTGKIYVNGWTHSVTLHSSYPSSLMLDACG